MNIFLYLTNIDFIWRNASVSKSCIKAEQKYFCNMIFMMLDIFVFLVNNFLLRFLYNLLHFLFPEFEIIKQKLRCFSSEIFL